MCENSVCRQILKHTKGFCMSNHITKQGVLFKGLSKKALVARFDQEQASSDGGAVLLKACDERLGLSAAMALCLRDARPARQG